MHLHVSFVLDALFFLIAGTQEESLCMQFVHHWPLLDLLYCWLWALLDHVTWLSFLQQVVDSHAVPYLLVGQSTIQLDLQWDQLHVLLSSAWVNWQALYQAGLIYHLKLLNTRLEIRSILPWVPWYLFVQLLVRFTWNGKMLNATMENVTMCFMVFLKTKSISSAISIRSSDSHHRSWSDYTSSLIHSQSIKFILIPSFLYSIYTSTQNCNIYVHLLVANDQIHNSKCDYKLINNDEKHHSDCMSKLRKD